MKISPRPWNAFSDADAAVGIIKVIFEKTKFYSRTSCKRI